MPPAPRYEDHLQVHQILGLASAFEAMGCSAYPDTSWAKVDHPTRVMHFGYHSSEPPVEKMNLDVSPLTSVQSRTGLTSHAELSFNVAATFPEASA